MCRDLISTIMEPVVTIDYDGIMEGSPLSPKLPAARFTQPYIKMMLSSSGLCGTRRRRGPRRATTALRRAAPLRRRPPRGSNVRWRPRRRRRRPTLRRRWAASRRGRSSQPRRPPRPSCSRGSRATPSTASWGCSRPTPTPTSTRGSGTIAVRASSSQHDLTDTILKRLKPGLSLKQI